MAAAPVTCCKTVCMDMNKIFPYQKLVAALLLLSAGLIQTAHAAEAVRMDQIAAVVNSDAIMMSEASERARVLAASSKAKLLTPQQLLKKAVDELILERLQVQQAEKQNINIDDVTLNKAVESIARQNKLSLPQFRQALQQEGIDYDNFREQTRRRLMVDALRQRQIGGKVKVSDQEVQDLIAINSASLTKGERYHLQHILVSAPNGTPVARVNAARQRAEDIRRRIIAGEDFNRIASSESDSNAAREGGSLGWQEAEKLPPSFRRTLALMQPGEISEVVRDPQGFHILKLLDRQGGERRMVNDTHARHILVSTEKYSDAQAKQKIDGIYQQLAGGADFAALAKANSDDPGSGSKGGDLGWVKQGQTVAPFEQAMNSSPLNAISQPFRTRFGWHIVQVLERRQADNTEQALRAKATDFLGDRKAEEQFQAWLQGLRNEAYIEYRIPANSNQPQM